MCAMFSWSIENLIKIVKMAIVCQAYNSPWKSLCSPLSEFHYKRIKEKSSGNCHHRNKWGEGWWGGREVKAPAYVWIRANPFIYFSLILFKWQRASAYCFVRGRGLWKYKESTKSVYFPGTSLSLFLGLGKEERTTTFLISGGRKVVKLFEYVFLLIWRRLLCGWARDLVP